MSCSLIVAYSSEPGFGWTSASGVLEPGNKAWLAFRSMRINGDYYHTIDFDEKSHSGLVRGRCKFYGAFERHDFLLDRRAWIERCTPGADWNPVTSQSAQIRSKVCIETDLRGLGEFHCFKDERRSAINLEGKNLGWSVQCTLHNRGKEDCVKTHLVQIRVVAIR
jgi:hypothetical protein